MVYLAYPHKTCILAFICPHFLYFSFPYYPHFSKKYTCIIPAFWLNLTRGRLWQHCYDAGKVSHGAFKVSHGSGKASTDYCLLSESFALQECRCTLGWKCTSCNCILSCYAWLGRLEIGLRPTWLDLVRLETELVSRPPSSVVLFMICYIS